MPNNTSKKIKKEFLISSDVLVVNLMIFTYLRAANKYGVGIKV